MKCGYWYVPARLAGQELAAEMFDSYWVAGLLHSVATCWKPMLLGQELEVGRLGFG